MPASHVQKDRQSCFWSLIREGLSSSSACEAICVDRRQGCRWIRAAGGRVPVPDRPRSGRHLGQDDRLRIADLRINGAGVRVIARELRRNSRPNTGAYWPYAAQRRCDERALRPKSWRLARAVPVRVRGASRACSHLNEYPPLAHTPSFAARAARRHFPGSCTRFSHHGQIRPSDGSDALSGYEWRPSASAGVQNARTRDDLDVDTRA